MTTLATAQHWLNGGIATIPVPARKKAATLTWKQYQTTLPSKAELVSWFSNGANLAVVTAHRGLTVIDFDDMRVYNDWLAYGDRNPWAATVQRFTYRVLTSKGCHIYVRIPEATKSRALVRADGTRWGIDIKSRGGYVLAPPSMHPDGSLYRAANEGAMIMRVTALSDILPPEMLVVPEYRVKGAVPVSTGDIWDRAMSAVSVGVGTADKIKAAITIESLLPVLQVTGPHHYVTRCPLHDDHNPSMWVDTAQQVCGCYAGCTVLPLDVINLYSRIHDLSNSEAIRELARGL